TNSAASKRGGKTCTRPDAPRLWLGQSHGRRIHYRLGRGFARGFRAGRGDVLRRRGSPLRAEAQRHQRERSNLAVAVQVLLALETLERFGGVGSPIAVDRSPEVS